MRAQRLLTKSISMGRSGHQDGGPDRSPQAARATASNVEQPQEDRRVGAAAASRPLGERSPTWRWTNADSAQSGGRRSPAEHTMLEVGVSWQGGESLECHLGGPSRSPWFTCHEAGTRAEVCPDDRSRPHILPALQQDSRLMAGGPPSKSTRPPCPEGNSAGRPRPGHDEALEAEQCPCPCRTNTDPPSPVLVPRGHRAGQHSFLDGRSRSGNAQKQSQTRRAASKAGPGTSSRSGVPARAAA